MVTNFRILHQISEFFQNKKIKKTYGRWFFVFFQNLIEFENFQNWMYVPIFFSEYFNISKIIQIDLGAKVDFHLDLPCMWHMLLYEA
jgi:hypothetical protein